AIAQKLKGLHAPLGVYAVLGNHDWWYSGAEVRKALEDVGIHVLDNEVTELRRNRQSLWIAGVSDYWTRHAKLKETLALLPPGQPAILITHHPDLLPQIPASVLLTIAAHTHGGQVNLPF